jgi:AcrR family transcriptional regulator
MTPRRYTLGRRAESAAATRDAILDAAMAVFLEAGSAKVPLTVIAQRADVSRGTILHHFGDSDGLVDAVIGRVLPTLALPDERVLDGLHDSEARLRAYVGAMVAFFRRSTPWWRVFEAEMGRQAAKEGEATYWEAFGRLQAAALGPELAADGVMQATIGGVLHPGAVGSLLWALEQSGMTTAAADLVVEDLVIGFVRIRGSKAGDEVAAGRILAAERGRGGSST